MILPAERRPVRSLSNSRNESDLPILLRRTQNHDPRTKLVAEIVDQGAQLTTVQ